MPPVLKSRDPVLQPVSESRAGRTADDWPARHRTILAQFTTSQLVTVTTRAGDAGADTGQLLVICGVGVWDGLCFTYIQPLYR